MGASAGSIGSPLIAFLASADLFFGARSCAYQRAMWAGLLSPAWRKHLVVGERAQPARFKGEYTRDEEERSEEQSKQSGHFCIFGELLRDPADTVKKVDRAAHSVSSVTTNTTFRYIVTRIRSDFAGRIGGILAKQVDSRFSQPAGSSGVIDRFARFYEGAVATSPGSQSSGHKQRG